MESIICECGTPEHQILFKYDEEDNYIYTMVRIVPEQNILKRIKNACIYILGHKSRFGDYDEIILSTSNSDSLYSTLKYMYTYKDSKE